MKRLLVALLAACGDVDGGGGSPDAGALPTDAHHEPGDITDFFGEACRPDPYPANTVCHDDRGWCVDGACRPMCGDNARRCPGAVERHAESGACYCEPR